MGGRVHFWTKYYILFSRGVRFLVNGRTSNLNESFLITNRALIPPQKKFHSISHKPEGPQIYFYFSVNDLTPIPEATPEAPSAGNRKR
jgi:hypothetical protein